MANRSTAPPRWALGILIGAVILVLVVGGIMTPHFHGHNHFTH